MAALEWLSTPAEGILNANSRSSWYRNDELLDGLDRHFNRDHQDFFATLAFECEVDAALSWTLPEAEATRIARAFYREPAARRMPGWIDKRVRALKKWFGNGGGPTP